MTRFTALLAALTLALTACQPTLINPGPQTPTAHPITPGTAAPTTPGTGTDATINGLTAKLVVPAGAISKLRTDLRTRATTALTTADLGKLTLTIDGKTFGPDQFTFTDVSTDVRGNLIAILKVDDALVPYTVLTLRTPAGNFALKMIIPGAGNDAQIDVSSTARALIAERMKDLGKTYDEAALSAEAVAVVADRLLSILISSSTTDVLHAANLVRAVQLVTDAVLNGKGTDSATLSQIRTDANSPPSGGGGGGGGSDGSTADESTTVTVAPGYHVDAAYGDADIGRLL